MDPPSSAGAGFRRGMRRAVRPSATPSAAPSKIDRVAALYRKCRPQDFDEVVGQEAIVRTLKNAISSGQVRQAYLFAGPRGAGKTWLPRMLAKGLNCAQGPTPSPDKVCNACVTSANG